MLMITLGGTRYPLPSANRIRNLAALPSRLAATGLAASFGSATTAGLFSATLLITSSTRMGFAAPSAPTTFTLLGLFFFGHHIFSWIPFNPLNRHWFVVTVVSFVLQHASLSRWAVDPSHSTRNMFFVRMRGSHEIAKPE
jgi:hypothetical protein